jgi:hypothetical protein
MSDDLIWAKTDLHAGMFWPGGSARVKRIILSMGGGTVVIFVMYSVNLGIWFGDLVVVRGVYLIFEASATLLVEFWILNHLGQLAASTPRSLAIIDVEQVETQSLGLRDTSTCRAIRPTEKVIESSST